MEEKYRDLKEEEEERTNEETHLTPGERFAAIWGMLSASLVIGMIYLGAFALLIWLMTRLW